jgi:hypothetical protein
MKATRKLTLDAVEDIARRILAEDPHPIVHFRLLRDVLSASGKDLETARRDLESSRHVQMLRQEQRPDGSWGRFHSVDTRLKRKTGTTQDGVRRALSAGLDADHPILRKATRYIAGILRGMTRFPDPAEANDRWPTGSWLFAASTLALIQPDHPALDPVRTRWLQVVSHTFASGRFDPVAEAQAHHDLHGINTPIAYLTLRNRFAAELLGSRPDLLPPPIERAYVEWLWHQPNGLAYLDIRFSSPQPAAVRSSGFARWLNAMHILSRFPSSTAVSPDAILWLWNQRQGDDLWDFGGKASHPRFSESWRQPRRRMHDHSLLPLILLRRHRSALTPIAAST